jgi:hypothetical protein
MPNPQHFLLLKISLQDVAQAHVAQALITQPIPGMASDRDGLYHVLPTDSLNSLRACSCGTLSRRLMFQRMGLERKCVEIYSWLIGDTRCQSCDHLNLVRGDEGEFISSEKALNMMIALPGSEPRMCAISHLGHMAL